MLDVEPGEELEADFSAEEEAEYLTGGRLEIVAREYEVVGTSVVHGAKPGERFTAALTVGQEQALFEGGHIERVDEVPLEKRTRPELETLALSLGVEEPGKLANKQAVIDAINAATDEKEG